MAPIPVFLPGESHGQRSLAGYTVQWVTESNMTERLSTHRSMSLVNADAKVLNKILTS